jgi:sensor histidine kinase YesM
VFTFTIPLDSQEANSALREIRAIREETAAAEESPISSLLRETSSSWSWPLTPHPPGGKEPNILIVDDDPVNLKVLTSILQAEQYRVTPALSGKEAIVKLGKASWDLAIIDVMMPHMSGYELTSEIRKQFSVSELPILLLTARSQPEDIYAGFSSGANDYVSKPIDTLELKYRIKALVTLKQSVNERLRMEAAYLQAQIQPHFLFNTLNSLLALSDIDTERMRNLGVAFASFLRISFDYLNTGELVTLSHEIELVKSYLHIEKERFEDRLTIEWEVDPNIELLLPPLSIQPLIENAVKHGLMSRQIGGVVRLCVTRADGYTLIEVIDNGIGMDQRKVTQLMDSSLKGESGVGITNTNRRLIQMYGQGLSISSKPNKGTTVSFIVPDNDRGSRRYEE